MIIAHKYPLSCIEHEWFRKVLSSLNRIWNNISCNTIKAYIMGLYELERSKVVSLIKSDKSKVVITTDMWACSSQTKGYMTIIVHFIDDSWTLPSQILRQYDKIQTFYAFYLFIITLSKFLINFIILLCRFINVQGQKRF